MKRQALALGVLAGAALLLAACKADVTSTVKSDGSGVLRAELGFTTAEKQQMEAMSSGSTTDLCNVSNVTGETPPAGMTFKQEERGDETWCVATQAFASLDELRQLPGIGPSLAQRVLEARPFGGPEDLRRVPGLGEAAILRLTPHLEFTAPEPAEIPR